MTLTVGTNSYATLVEAEAYMLTVMNYAKWTASTDDQKNRALATAFREMNEQSYNAPKLIETQEGAFPLSYQTTVPNDVKNAQIEWANEILNVDYNLALQLENGLTSKSIDNVSETYKTAPSKNNTTATVRKSLRLLRKYLSGGTAGIR